MYGRRDGYCATALAIMVPATGAPRLAPCVPRNMPVRRIGSPESHTPPAVAHEEPRSLHEAVALESCPVSSDPPLPGCAVARALPAFSQALRLPLLPYTSLACREAQWRGPSLPALHREARPQGRTAMARGVGPWQLR